ncbi:hypothetical protein BGZ76_004409 [Entomortierella beljakovae]|nr:hypothetical protein BGZ76_004409 [Entomortierella beljakovae]
MRTQDSLHQPISAPIPVPGTQQEPTVPSALALSAACSSILNISGPSHDRGGRTSNSSSSSSLMALGIVGQNSSYLANTLHVGPSRHHSLSGVGNNTGNDITKDGPNKSYININHNNPNNVNSGLRRLPSLVVGNSKKLNVENTNLRAKVIELERYLTGLKEELILAHRQIQIKNKEAKTSQDRKAVEIHELAQHIQRCESELLSKSAECEALLNKLQYQTKEQMSKLKHITLLESELLDYKRMSTLSGSGGNASAVLRISRNSSDLSESARSSTVFISGNNSVVSNEEAMVQIKQLKEENARKDEQVDELINMVAKLKADVSQLEERQTQQNAVSQPVSASNSDVSLSDPLMNRSGSSGPSSVNSVGYDVASEHPKLLVRYQALRMQHAQASEYISSLESENRDLRVQMLDVSPSLHSNTSNINVEDAVAVNDTLESTAVVIPSSSAGSLHHPKASTLTPLNMDTLDSEPNSCLSTSTTTFSPTADSPSTIIAPALTRKSSLRYSRDGQPITTCV